ncbi:polysaccharide deacetylase family protein [Rhizobium sp. TRM96647]|uniref:polysaccharide deacetylase family protein n=1 Tax=unclassified Rhizobium TaxID=2613769 RepID=UPI0021E815F4|nr:MULTISPECIES: polysaccharide deacetylase family protein [unclassified Rhizobium]MCV3739484.1 polysaccharide deacetylase family protein [Rhizobium sp. TRM96647]MCV3761131.1 polysaccharide deacetylase family protein [Rhizobium sp. TRM96650]
MVVDRRRILNFHGVGEPLRALEPGEAPYWLGVDRFRAVLDRIVDHPDRDRLSITFDDGNASDLLIAAPELQRRGLEAEFFVLSGRIGEAGSLDNEQIRALMRMGMRIGSHGVAHSDWSSLSAHALQHELGTSKAALEEICAAPVQSAAIPFGRYNAAVLRALRKAGYAVAYSSDGGSSATAAFLHPRTSLRQDMTDRSLEDVLSGNIAPWRRLRRFAGMTARAWI